MISNLEKLLIKGYEPTGEILGGMNAYETKHNKVLYDPTTDFVYHYETYIQKNIQQDNLVDK